jgi:hypothetical protein
VNTQQFTLKNATSGGYTHKPNESCNRFAEQFYFKIKHRLAETRNNLWLISTVDHG